MAEESPKPAADESAKPQANPVHGAIGCITLILIAVVVLAMCRGGGDEPEDGGVVGNDFRSTRAPKPPKGPSTEELVTEVVERCRDRFAQVAQSGPDRSTAIERIRNQFNSEFAQALEPLKTRRDQEYHLVQQIESRFVRIIVAEPEETLNGYQGKDEFSGKFVYIETARHRPQPLGGTLILGPIQGQFMRDGEVTGQNAFGTQISIPRFVDTPDSQQLSRHFVRLRNEYSEWQRKRESLLQGLIDEAAPNGQ